MINNQQLIKPVIILLNSIVRKLARHEGQPVAAPGSQVQSGAIVRPGSSSGRRRRLGASSPPSWRLLIEASEPRPLPESLTGPVRFLTQGYTGQTPIVVEYGGGVGGRMPADGSPASRLQP